MIVQCVSNHGVFSPFVLPEDPTRELGENNYCSSGEWFTLDSSDVGYCLTVEKQYRVYGFIVVNGTIRYLLDDDNHIPGFFPADLFRICEHDVSSDWVTNFFVLKDITLFYTSHRELSEYADIVGLVSCKPSAVRKFIELREHLAYWNL